MKIAHFDFTQPRTFIIAELSANHGHSLDIAKQTIRAAKKAGADAIKLQTYTADTLTLNCNKEDFIVKGGTLWDNKTYYQLYQEAYTPWEWHAAIQAEAEKLGDKMLTQVDKDGNPIFTPLVVISLLLFILIYFPCIAVVAAVKGESGSWKWALFTIVYTTGLAWILSFLVFQIGSLLGF